MWLFCLWLFTPLHRGSAIITPMKRFLHSSCVLAISACAALSANAQCYRFTANTASTSGATPVSLTVNITSPGAPSVQTTTTNLATVTTAVFTGIRGNASLVVGQATTSMTVTGLIISQEVGLGNLSQLTLALNSTPLTALPQVAAVVTLVGPLSAFPTSSVPSALPPLTTYSGVANAGATIGGNVAPLPAKIDSISGDCSSLGVAPSPTVNTGGIVPLYGTVSTIQAGEWFSIYGANLAASTSVWNGDFPTFLGGTSVTVNGKPAFLWFVSSTQINLQAPDDTATGTVPVVIKTASGTITSSVTLATVGPSFSLLDSKHVTGIILRSDGSGAYAGGTYDIIGPTGKSLGYPTVAAKARDSIVLFAVGLGPTTPAVPAGKPFSGAAPTASPISLTINGVNVVPAFAGLSSAGLYQINFTLPAGLGTGDAPLVASVAGAQTQSTVVISLQ